ncbi:hypothetical protein Dvina_45105 [Dactylosporangium vinaceum]|uniref:Plasmid replication, integration and excision activator n=1 Tax=Dactylosporangium vinaceum TaxID=53362 RepID=A0ABV5MIL0_9ACTN|nr:hypothetical protein [Dactylosporangium vinaceum]UAB95154.1 hypothetical protein Dvina_45105 [Dactylosporangium vinaceum]
MKYMLDTSGYEFEVAKTAVPKVDEKRQQKMDPVSGNPVWVVEMSVYFGEDEGASQIDVSIASASKPELRWRQPVEMDGLEIIPWASKGRSDRDPIRQGVSFRAREIRPVDAARLQAVA